jgi:undecaprenyl-diphosphatase
VAPTTVDPPGSGFSHPAVAGMDAAVDRLAAALRGRAAPDRVLYALSQAGNHSLVWHGINAVDALVGGPVHRRRALRRSVVLAIEQGVVNGPIKSVFRRDRPGHVEDHPHQLRRPATSSFPSGHASAGACATVLLARDLGAGPAWAGLAAAVAWSRIHVGAHHASDVAGGAVIGTVLALVADRAWPPPGRTDPIGRYRDGDARG